jgi:hypothetical protein
MRIARANRARSPPDSVPTRYAHRVRGALLLHTGAETFWIAKKVLAVPWWRVL